MRCFYRTASGSSGFAAASTSYDPALSALSASTVTYVRRHFSAPTRLSLSPPPPPPPRSGATVSEERVARWCRRLWDLTRKSTGSVASAHLTPQLYLASDRETAALLSSSLPTFTSPPQADGNGEVMAEVALTQLRRAIHSDQGRIPGVIVESVWAAFDVLVPPVVQDSATNDNITSATEDNFFLFISTLNELNFDLDAVVRASARLAAKVDTYLTLLRQAEAQETQRAAAATASGTAQAACDEGEPTELMKAKGEVMQCCFEARNAGSPLYYTWLWHTAAMPDGLRRLMHFRKLTHFFESLCKRHIKNLTPPPPRSLSSLAPVTDESVGSPSAAATASSTERDRCAGELSKWHRRLVEVGLISRAMSLLFHDFFSKEYLVMEELTWPSTPPSMLDQIMRAESVHPFVRGLEDMRHRLQPAHHRHLFAFLHPAVVDEPLIAVQVALTHGITSSVDQILGRPTPLSDPVNMSQAALYFRDVPQSSSTVDCAGAADDGNVNTAIFYSINSAQSALRGMDMGNRLIKRVVQEVKGNINARRQARSLTPINTFCTLSPIPLYVKWLADEVAALAATAATVTTTTATTSGIFGSQFSPAEEETRCWEPLREAVLSYVLRHPDVLPTEGRAVMRATEGSSGNPTAVNTAVLRYLVCLLQSACAASSLSHDDSAPFGAGSTPTQRHQQPWWMDHTFTMALEDPLLRSVATYLCTAKRSHDGRILDPVGNFHVSNGATVYRLNFLANTTPQASRESACVMVNYLYDLPRVLANAAQYEVSRTVSLGEPIKALLGN
ncbi:malonyl-coa decarboxylase-like protein [Leishmania guyanensis]|uniref:Putative malonyl-coa decarboxylase-like protein n=1 Tax=Leishmania guyanensis TaxID=5670 RepID=A0A1E1IPT8_LEIGU|nr:Putative malonyl-coa decarboxylase-like protein [Leishmania guyanensis]